MVILLGIVVLFVSPIFVSKLRCILLIADHGCWPVRKELLKNFEQDCCNTSLVDLKDMTFSPTAMQTIQVSTRN